jgi:hypothetical protein
MMSQSLAFGGQDFEPQKYAPQGLKPPSFLGIIGTTKQVAEKVRTKSEFGEGWVSRG